MDEWTKVKTLIDQNIDHHDYIKHNIINRIIKLKDNEILQQSINHLHTTTIPTEILVPLYKKMYKNNDLQGIDHLIMFYHYKGANKKRFKYLNIGWYKFKDQRSLCSLIHHYSVNKDYDNVEKYHNILKIINPSIAQFMIGMEHKLRSNYDEMIINMDNDINIPLLQFILHKLNITNSSILGHIQFKLNKTKLKDPVYNKTGSCNICFSDDVQLQLFDCLGHYYCQDCTISMDKCAICRCSKKCSHI